MDKKLGPQGLPMLEAFAGSLGTCCHRQFLSGGPGRESIYRGALGFTLGLANFRTEYQDMFKGTPP